MRAPKKLQKKIVALAGNPNVGKSSLFNALTGLHHHTGNWSGKTVEVSSGYRRMGNTVYEFVDLPGTYSLAGNSQDERLAAEFIQAGRYDCVVVVCDGACLERNLILALQIMERAEKVILCVNLMDEARRQGIRLDAPALQEALGIPVVCTAVPGREGLQTLLRQVERTILSPPSTGNRPQAHVQRAQDIASRCVRQGQEEVWRRELDRILVSRRYGVPILLLLLLTILCLTVWGANLPSQALQALFDRGYDWLRRIPIPDWLQGLLLDGMYATSARVIAVMLPPMAIFFPLFTILEDVGYLPRMAFLLDSKMRRCGGCGKQALTLCMGLGCNAVGVTGCRILSSPRERLAAILTNAMVPCNGRFPTIILLSAILCSPGYGVIAAAGAVLLGVLGAVLTTGVLSKTALRHRQSLFLLELPPLRRPRVGQILVRSLLDRTGKVALRALCVAAPAGGILWGLANTPLLETMVKALEPMGNLLGMNGLILTGFLLSIPANELMIPVILLAVTGAESIQGIAGGVEAVFSWQQALCALVFTVFHWPCSTTLLTIYKETGSKKQTAAAFILPTAVGMGLCVLLKLLLP